MTTHAIGNFRFGGTACGRVVRDILHSIEITEAETILKARGGGPGGGAEKKDGDTTPDPGNIRPGPDGPRDGGGTPRDPDDLRPRND